MTHSTELVQPSGAASAAPRIRLVGTEENPVWGLSGGERLRRMARQLGATIVDEAQDDEAVLLVRCDAVIGARMFAAMLRLESVVVLDEDGAAAVAAAAPPGRAAELEAFLRGGRWIGDEQSLPLPVLRPTDLDRAFDESLRRRPGRPIARLVDAENTPRAEWSLYNAANLGVTDIVAKYLWLYPAFHLARTAQRAGVPAMAVTAGVLLLSLLAALLFLNGGFAAGLVVAWAASLADAADGKLARVTVATSPLGDALDRGTDILAPPIWYAAWLAGLAATGQMAGPWVWIAVMSVGLYFGCKLQELWFYRRHNLGLYAWRAFDSWFRLIAAGRNTNLVILTLFALAKSPYLAIAGVAVWTGFAFAVQLVRIVQAEGAGTIRSWMEP